MGTLALFALVVSVAIVDLRYRKIPNFLVGLGVLLLIALFIPMDGQQQRLVEPPNAILGVAVSLLLSLPGWLLHKLGGGDVKLSMLLGAFLGPLGFLWSVVLAVPFGLVFCLCHHFAGRPVSADLPVGAFLAGGASIVLIGTV